jgi:predicted ester cyclase
MYTIKTVLTLLIIIMLIGLQSCSESPVNEEKLRSTIIETNEEIFNKKNLDYADKVFTQDFAGKGPQFIKDFASDLVTAFPDLNVTTESIVVEGNQAGWFRTNTGTHKKDYLGYPASGKKITWTEILFTKFSDDGMIVADWYATDLNEKLQSATNIEGVYQYLPPNKGQAIIKSSNYLFLFGPSDGSQPMIGQAGTYTLSNDTVKVKVLNSTIKSQEGSEYWWRVKSWQGDTVTYETMNTRGEITGMARSLRLHK